MRASKIQEFIVRLTENFSDSFCSIQDKIPNFPPENMPLDPHRINGQAVFKQDTFSLLAFSLLVFCVSFLVDEYRICRSFVTMIVMVGVRRQAIDY
jgi:hypothetical protein